jgi:D-alanine--poly(phosphoribitol) ligase subunit 2
MEEQIYGILFKEGRLRPPLSQNDQLFDHGLDSPGVVDVMMALEETFDVIFPDEFLNRRTFSTINSIVAAIKKIKHIA